jgi:hypothetical protein
LSEQVDEEIKVAMEQLVKRKLRRFVGQPNTPEMRAEIVRELLNPSAPEHERGGNA